MALAYTKYPADAFEKLQINAGVVATDFDTATGALDNTDILGATTGGINVSITPNTVDYGEDVDNVPVNTKQLKVITDWVAVISGSLVTTDAATTELLVGAADTTGTKIAPRADLANTDFKDLWFIGDYGDRSGTGGYVAVKLINALSTGGFVLQTQKNGKGSFTFEFTGHYDLTDDTRTPPFEIYVKAGTSQVSNGGGTAG